MAEYLYSTQAETKTSFDKFKELLVRQKSAIFISIILLIAASAVFYFLQSKEYEAAAVISFDDKTSLYLSKNQNLNLDQELQYLSSESFLQKAASGIVSSDNSERPADLFLEEKPESPSSDTAAITKTVLNQLKEDSDFERRRNSLYAYVKSPNPEGAELAAETLAKTYINSIKNRFDNSGQIVSFIEEKAGKRKTELDKNQKALEDFKGDNRTVILAERYTTLIRNIAGLEAELEKKEIERQLSQILQEDYKKTLDRINNSLSQSVFAIDDQYIKQLKEKISDIQAEISTRKIGIGRQSGGNTEAQLASYKKEFENEINNYVEDLIKNKDLSISEEEVVKEFALKIQRLQINEKSSEKSKASIYDQLTNYEYQYSRIPNRSSELADLTRKTFFDEQVYSKLENLEQSEDWREFASVNTIAGLDYSVSLIGKTGYGLVYLLLIGLGAGIIIGVIVASGMNMFFSYVNSPEDIDSFGLKLIAVIPKLKPKPFSKKENENNNSLLFAEADYKLASESFKRLEEYLKNAFLDKEVKSLIITSPMDEDGKSTIASNLAITIANLGSKVLLVDANMRNPILAKLFNADSSSSLPHYLFKKKELNEIIVKTHVPNLNLIPSIEFNQNLSLVLSSKMMKSFMQLVNSEYDYVIYDTPSISKATDAILISDNVDETILVTRDEKTSFEEMRKTLKQYESNEVTIGGVVLNDYNMRKLSPEYEEYYGFNHLMKEPKKGKSANLQDETNDIDLGKDIQFDVKEDNNKTK